MTQYTHVVPLSHLVLFAEVDGEVDGAVFSRWRGRRDPARPVGRVVEIGDQTRRVTAAGLSRVADRRVQVARRRSAVLSPTTSQTTSSRPPSNLPRLHLTTDLPLFSHFLSYLFTYLLTYRTHLLTDCSSRL